MDRPSSLQKGLRRPNEQSSSNTLLTFFLWVLTLAANSFKIYVNIVFMWSLQSLVSGFALLFKQVKENLVYWATKDTLKNNPQGKLFSEEPPYFLNPLNQLVANKIQSN